MGRLTQSTEEIQSILDSVQDKADKADVVQPDWDATRGKAAVKNRPFGFNNPIRLSDADEIIDEVIDPDYDTHKITYKFLNWQFEGGLLMYVKGMLYDYNYEYEDYYYNRLYSGDYFRVRDYGNSAIIEVAFDGYNNDDNNYETIITITRENLYDDVRAAIEEDVILAVDEVALRTSLPDIFIPDSIARQESVLELYEEASLLWDETSSLWEETVSLNGEVSDIKGRVEELENGDGFDAKGIYPDLIAGDLAGRGESVPAEFSFRASGGKSIKDGRAYIKRIKGNSVVWNQILNNLGAGAADKTETDTEVRIVPNSAENNRYGNGVNVVAGHHYLQMVDILSEEGTSVGFQNYLNLNCDNKTTSTSYVQLWQIAQASASGTSHVQLWSKEGTPYRIKKDSFNLINLTLMFGAGNEPTTIEEFNARKPIVADEYAYNEGEVIPFTAEGIKSVGDNAWDEQWEVGYLEASTGENTETTTTIRSKNFCPILGGEQYYLWDYSGSVPSIVLYDENYQYIDYFGVYHGACLLDIDSRARYFKMAFQWNYGNTYKNDIMVSLYHSGWKAEKDGQYQPYWEDTLLLNDPRIAKEFPNGIHIGDKVYNKDGKGYIRKGTGTIDLGSLSWFEFSEVPGVWGTGDLKESIQHPLDNGVVANIICDKYACREWFGSTAGVYQTVDGICADMYGDIYVGDKSFTSAASFKASLSGIILYYELAEPTIIEYDEPFNLDYEVADFGTEEIIASKPSAPLKADIIYQFNAVDMIRENYNEIQKLKEMLNVMQAQLISLTNK